MQLSSASFYLMPIWAGFEINYSALAYLGSNLHTHVRTCAYLQSRMLISEEPRPPRMISSSRGHEAAFTPFPLTANKATLALPLSYASSCVTTAHRADDVLRNNNVSSHGIPAPDVQTPLQAIINLQRGKKEAAS